MRGQDVLFGAGVGVLALLGLIATSCLGLEDSEASSADASTEHTLADGAWPDGKIGSDGASTGGAPSQLTPKTKDELPPTAGDGYIGYPSSTCQGGVHEDGANCGSQPCIAVGTDPPCGQQAKYRAYIRFELGKLGSAKPTSATLNLYLLTKSNASAGAKLLQIVDFGSLENDDWNSSVIHDYSTFLTPSSPLDWTSQDVTKELLAALDAGAPAIAFMLVYENESQSVSSSNWYGIGCAENSAAAPYIALTY